MMNINICVIIVYNNDSPTHLRVVFPLIKRLLIHIHDVLLQLHKAFELVIATLLLLFLSIHLLLDLTLLNLHLFLLIVDCPL